MHHIIKLFYLFQPPNTSSNYLLDKTLRHGAFEYHAHTYTYASLVDTGKFRYKRSEVSEHFFPLPHYVFHEQTIKRN